jgi:phosphoenolpyruvate synthase/pyruvate phosphate dikinase
MDTPPVALLEERRKSCVIYWDLAGHEIVSGAETAAIRSAVLGEKKISDIQDFRGMTASLGNAQGKVKILRSVKEINKIEAGDVLVAVMTRPDYVPAMKKAVAIITDEGGITSHAAIVSRELKIPCVIGTKIATQVLRDGDMVQVNANHGMIKILKRAENS